MYLSSLLSKLPRYGKFKQFSNTIYTAEIFQRRKLSQIGGKCFFLQRKLSQFACLSTNRCHAPRILRRKLTQIATKSQNSQKFSPLKVSHCTVCCRQIHSLPQGLLPQHITGQGGHTSPWQPGHRISQPNCKLKTVVCM